VGVKTKIIEQPIMEGLEELDIYDEEGVEMLMEEDSISDQEEAFMMGFLAS
jgi:hypothetical protein